MPPLGFFCPCVRQRAQWKFPVDKRGALRYKQPAYYAGRKLGAVPLSPKACAVVADCFRSRNRYKFTPRFYRHLWILHKARLIFYLLRLKSI